MRVNSLVNGFVLIVELVVTEDCDELELVFFKVLNPTLDTCDWPWIDGLCIVEEVELFP